MAPPELNRATWSEAVHCFAKQHVQHPRDTNFKEESSKTRAKEIK